MNKITTVEVRCTERYRKVFIHRKKAIFSSMEHQKWSKRVTLLQTSANEAEMKKKFKIC
jgi:hypothetical protein